MSFKLVSCLYLLSYQYSSLHAWIKLEKCVEKCKRTENYNHWHVYSAVVVPVCACIWTADSLDVVVKSGSFQQCADIAAPRTLFISLKYTGLIGAARRIDDGIAVVRPGYFILPITNATHVGELVFTANNQCVLRRNYDCAKHTCTRHSSLGYIKQQVNCFYTEVDEGISSTMCWAVFT